MLGDRKMDEKTNVMRILDKRRFYMRATAMPILAR